VTRREVIALLGSTTALSWPQSARAQSSERVRRVGVLLPAAADDLEYQARLEALVEGLARLGWISGHNLRIDVRWAIGDTEHFGREAEKLLGAEPDVIVASSSLAVAALQKATRTVPIVFGAVVDPVGSGFVASWARPGGNITGFTNFEYALSPAPSTCGLFGPSLCGERRSHLVRTGTDRSISARSHLRRPHPQGREARRPAGPSADQVRAGDQPKNGQSARDRRATAAARARRRGHRVGIRAHELRRSAQALGTHIVRQSFSSAGIAPLVGGE